MDYQKFLEAKSQSRGNSGFEPLWMPDTAFDFQQALIGFATEKGRSALFSDCGTGKTLIGETFAENVVRKTNKRFLILTPLAVGSQFVTEGEKFGIECVQSRDGKLPRGKKIIVTNYERLHYFNPNDFVGALCDESSILKNPDGVIRGQVTEFMRQLKYRQIATATPAPNDFVELGTSSEAIGELGYMDMLSWFFKNDQNSNHPNRNFAGAKWRFRGHAERDFWRWICSWARAIRKPSDLGFSDDKFILPPLTVTQHVIAAKTKRDGFLFDLPAVNLQEQREERRRTLTERCEKAAELITNHTTGSSVAWCHLNPEGDLLEKLIPGAVQVKGADSLEQKEEALDAFRKGQISRMVSKGDICGHGLNFQICDHQTFFPSHSFELWYQCVRRSWRFGQSKPVTIDIVTSEGETRVLENLQRKSKASELMFDRLVELMLSGLKIERKTTDQDRLKLPSFI